MSQSPPLVITKILPPRRRDDVLRRGRLLDFLHRHVDRRLLLVCGPAGYGKTTLLVDFAHELEVPVCWYTIGSEDCDAKVFFRYFVAAVSRQFPQFGQRMLPLLESYQDVGREPTDLVGALVNELHAATSDFFFLVLDDYHWLDGQVTINKAIDLLLQYLPDNCHLAIASRTLPKITISRLAAHQQVAGLGVADLRFNAQEIRELLSRNYDILLPDKQAEALAKESEGWISAILLTRHSLWQGEFEGLLSAKGGAAALFDFLASEVFAAQPDPIKRFLLYSSVLEDVSAERCEQLFGAVDAANTLRALEEDNLFLGRVDGGWYRYHNLFRDYLLSRLEAQDPETHRRLNVRAAQMAASRGDWSQAVGHYLRAGELAEVASVVEAQAETLIESGLWETVVQWTDHLQGTPWGDRPAIKLARGQCLLYRGSGEEPVRLLSEAVEGYRAQGDRPGTLRALATRSMVLRARGRYDEAVADCEAALSLAAGDDDPVLLEVLKQLGTCLAQQGKLGESVAVLERALRLSERLFREYDAGYIDYTLGVTQARLGNVAKASVHYQRAVQHWEAAGRPTHLTQALISQGMLHYYQGEYNEAATHFEAALARARDCGHLRSEAYALCSLADVRRDTGCYGEAMEKYESSLVLAERLRDFYLAVYVLCAIGNTYRFQGDFARAERTIKRALMQAEERGSAYEIGLCEISLGAVYNELGEYARAVRHLKRAQRLLGQAGMKREAAVAQLHLAQTAFATGRKREAKAHLTSAVEIAAELGYDEFLFVEGRRLRPLLAWAVANQVGGKRLELVLQRVDTCQPPPPALSLVPPLTVIAPPKMPAVRARALGTSEVLCDGEPVERQRWQTDKAREMFFYLLSNQGWVRRDRVMCALWPELDMARAESSFHTTLHRLRRALFAEVVEQGNGRYRCNPDADLWYDVAEFESALAQAKAVDDQGGRERVLRRAIALYGGSFLDDCYSEWAETKRKQLEQKYLAALDDLASLLAARGDLSGCLALYEAILNHDAYREETQRAVIKCYALLGDRAAAVRRYREYADLLERELGVQPSARTQALYEQIMRGDVSSSQRA